MKHIKLVTLLLIITIYLVGCSEEKLVSLDEVMLALEEEKITVEELAIDEQNVFHREINGVEPKLFKSNGGTISIYAFSSSIDLDRGKEMFEEMTAIISLRPFKQFEIHNILIYANDLSAELEEKLEEVIEKLE